ncbi:methyltransferase [Nocardia sp. NPDC060256]|uniref:methyltransferase n=1 Tax=unclassified Nocardia TaxID=2637762 RepID=UPI0036669F2C
MTNSFFTGVEGRLVAERYDFTRATTVVDVGGGNGHLLTAIVQGYPLVEGILFDRPEVTREAREQFASGGLSERCRAVVGDIFSSIPRGADHYILNSVLRNCDNRCVARLFNACGTAMDEASTLLMITYEARLGGNRLRSTDRREQALIELGGAERSEPELRTLLRPADLRLDANIDTHSAIRILVCRKANSQPLSL